MVLIITRHHTSTRQTWLAPSHLQRRMCVDPLCFTNEDAFRPFNLTKQNTVWPLSFAKEDVFRPFAFTRTLRLAGSAAALASGRPCARARPCAKASTSCHRTATQPLSLGTSWWSLLAICVPWPGLQRCRGGRITVFWPREARFTFARRGHRFVYFLFVRNGFCFFGLLARWLVGSLACCEMLSRPRCWSPGQGHRRECQPLVRSGDASGLADRGVLRNARRRRLSLSSRWQLHRRIAAD